MFSSWGGSYQTVEKTFSRSAIGRIWSFLNRSRNWRIEFFYYYLVVPEKFILCNCRREIIFLFGA